MPGKIVADLHNHSTVSDGEYTPTELVAKAKELGLKVLGLTDHDTIAGLEEAIQAGEKYGIRVVPGVEVSLAFKRPYFVGTLHLLLYFKTELLNNAEFKNALNNVLSHGRGPALVSARVKEINAVFGPQGTQPMLTNPLTTEQLNQYSTNVTRRHFALALKEKHGIEAREQISQIIGNDSPAYIPSGINMKLLPPLLQQFPVFRVFAHPAAGSFPEPSHYKEVLPPIETIEKLWPEFIELGLDGIEVYYPGHTQEHRELLLQWAEKFGLVVTGGSDCHDYVQRPLGVEGLTEEQFGVFWDKVEAGR